MNTMEKQRRGDPGYAILMTLAVLSGMLLLIVPLVLSNSQASLESVAIMEETQSRFALHSARGILDMTGNLKGGGSLPLGMRNIALPGWEDVPLKLRSLNATGTGVAALRIANMLPASMMMARRGVLGTPILLPVDPSASITIDGVTPMDRTHVFIGRDVFVLDGVRLMGGVVPAGMSTTHEAGDPVFAVDIDITMPVLRINGQWTRVTRWTCDLAGLGGEFAVSPVVNVTANATVEFYPYRMEDSRPGEEVYIGIEVVDECSKINLNSLTTSLASSLGLSGFAAYATPVGRYPFISPDSLLGLGNLDIEKLSYLAPLVTTTSEPDFREIGKKNTCYPEDALPLPSGAMSLAVDDRVVFGAATGVGVYQHAVNFNTAPILVMARVLEGMGVANPFAMARAVETYRSGEGSAQDVDYMDGDENPFDGRGWASAEDEFMGFIANQFPTEGARVIKHVYPSGDVAGFSTANPVSAKIGFESGRVKTAQIVAGVVRNGRPAVMQRESRTLRQDKSPLYAGARSIILDAGNGWNLSCSSIRGLDWRLAKAIGQESVSGDLAFDAGGPPVPSSLLGIVGDKRVFTKYVSTANVTLGGYSAMTVASFNETISALGFTSPVIVDFGMRVQSKPWSALCSPTNTPAEPYNSGEPYLLPAADPFYETVLQRNGATWTRIIWQARESSGTPGELGSVALRINGVGQAGSLVGTSSGISTYSADINLTAETIRIRFDFSIANFHKITARLLPPTNPLSYPSPAEVIADDKPYACPQLFRIVAEYTQQNDGKNQTMYDVK